MIVNICFHGIGVCVREREEGESRYWVREPHFLRILDEIATHRDVRVSFDDGNISDVTIALPAMQAREMFGTFFALAGRLDDPVSLNASDLQLLRRSGMTIGSHGWSHISWRGMTDDVAHHELVEARAALIEASRGAVDLAALPLGRYDRKVIGRLEHCGYTTVYSSDRFRARPDSWFQARFSVTADDTRESVREMILHRPNLVDARNVLASAFKRVR